MGAEKRLNWNIFAHTSVASGSPKFLEKSAPARRYLFGRFMASPQALRKIPFQLQSSGD